MTDAVRSERPAVEVADVIRSHGEAFLKKHGSRLAPTRARRGLSTLWRPAGRRRLGGHVEALSRLRPRADRL